MEAEVTDALHLKLDRPLPLAPGSRVWLELIADNGEADAIAQASASLLARAYGQDEPDYSDAGFPINPED